MRSRLRVELPRMTAEQAIDLLDVLQRISEAVWRRHGDEMAAHPRLAGSTYPPGDYDTEAAAQPRDPDDEDRDVDF